MAVVDTTAHFAQQAQNFVQSIFGNVQGMTDVQRDIAQRLVTIQQGLISQSGDAAKDELELISRVRDPREFASAQAELVERHGQRYVDSVKQSVDIVANAWRAYSERLAKGVNEATDKADRAAKSA
jgi:hypothetical protein